LRAAGLAIANADSYIATIAAANGSRDVGSFEAAGRARLTRGKHEALPFAKEPDWTLSEREAKLGVGCICCNLLPLVVCGDCCSHHVQLFAAFNLVNDIFHCIERGNWQPRI
jgi:hypothetical protein